MHKVYAQWVNVDEFSLIYTHLCYSPRHKQNKLDLINHFRNAKVLITSITWTIPLTVLPDFTVRTFAVQPLKHRRAPTRVLLLLLVIPALLARAAVHARVARADGLHSPNRHRCAIGPTPCCRVLCRVCLLHGRGFRRRFVDGRSR